ncbi:MAG: GDYXXLXY domain-containing protein [Verrucomicrobiota bacterium]
MKTARVAIFLVVALVQLSAPGSIIWKREQTLRHGRVWKFKTAPVDPLDAIRGRYIALRFAAEAVPSPEPPGPERIPGGAIVYVALKEDADGFARVDRISVAPLKGDDVVKAENGYWRDQADHVSFPFNKLWVSEQNAVAADKAYAENSRRGNENAYVTVRVRDGDAALEQLYIDNQPLGDYLRVHQPK